MMREDFTPKGEDLIVEAREYVLHGLYRKYKERPRWFFKRVDAALVRAHKYDPGTCYSDNWLAGVLLHNSGLDKKEKEKVWERCEGYNIPDLIKEAILKPYDTAQELDDRTVSEAPEWIPGELRSSQ